jgi:hypothetical protein
MIDQSSILEMLAMITTALIGGIGWLFQTVFKQNNVMFEKIIKIQENVSQNQVESTRAMIQFDGTLNNIKNSLDVNTSYQKDILDALKSQNLIDTRKIVVSRNAGLVHSRKNSSSNIIGKNDSKIDINENLFAKNKNKNS